MLPIWRSPGGRGDLSTSVYLSCFFLKDTATPEIYPLPLHDALPIHWIAGQLARTDPADLVDTAVLLVSELVTNAVHASVAAAAAAGHGDPCGIELTVARTRDTVRIEVADSACGSLPVPSAPSADDESGRGMQVISALSKRW